MLRKIRKYVTDDNVGIREKLFRIILVVGNVMSVLTLLLGMTMQNFGLNAIPLVLTVLVVVVASILTVKYNKMDIAAILIGVVGFCGLLPYMFFVNGGPYSGVPIWYVLGILYMFLMFEGKKLFFLVTLVITVDAATYFMAYNNSELLTYFSTGLEMYQDSLFAVLIVAIPVGIFIRFQTAQLEKEKAITLSQKEELEKLSKSKDAFFANMSHEIRTPINTIIGLNEMILRETNSDEVAEDARNIKSASKMLLSIVNDVLDFSGLESGKMELVEVNYNPKNMFKELVNMVMVRMQEKKLQFVVDIDETLPQILKGDEKRIKQIVLNILINAVKYTNSGSVTLSAWGKRNDDGKLVFRISVADTGIGIRQEDLENLYDSFKRVDNVRNVKVEGSGLGLAITKQLVDLMGGDIKVDSIYMKGSEFTVIIEQDIIDEIPIGPYDFLAADGNREGKRYRQSFEAPEARILIVDDNDSSLMVVTKLLKATKLQIDTAKSGEECLNKTLEKAYNIVILDNMLPDTNGRKLLKKLRIQENGLCKNTPVILFSASVTDHNKQDYMDLGFDGCLSKPVDSLELEAEILKHLPQELVEYRLDYKSVVNDDNNIARMRRRKLKKIAVTSDCVCDLPQDLLEQYDIKIMYLYIETERGIFQDTREMDVDNIAGFLTDKSSRLKPVSALVEDFERFYADVLTESVDVIHISTAEHVGVTYSRAVAAAKGFAHVHVIESGAISGGQGIMVLYAAKLAQEGLSVNEIKTELLKVKGRIETSFLLPSVNIFYKSGFTDKISAGLCNMLNAHPVVRMRQSQMKMLGVRFGEIEAARRHFIHFRLRNKKRVDTGILIITHVCLSVKEQKELIKEVNRHVKFDKIIIQKACVTDACCSGIGTIGISYIVNEK